MHVIPSFQFAALVKRISRRSNGPLRPVRLNLSLSTSQARSPLLSLIYYASFHWLTRLYRNSSKDQSICLAWNQHVNALFTVQCTFYVYFIHVRICLRLNCILIFNSTCLWILINSMYRRKIVSISSKGIFRNFRDIDVRFRRKRSWKICIENREENFIERKRPVRIFRDSSFCRFSGNFYQFG